MSNWTRISTPVGIEYVHSCGARVYQYPRRAFAPAEWGVQLSQDRQGSGGFASMREAKAFVERFDAKLAA